MATYERLNERLNNNLVVHDTMLERLNENLVVHGQHIREVKRKPGGT